MRTVRLAWLTLLILLVVVPAAPTGAQTEADRLERLTSQLGGNGCAYTAMPYSRTSPHTCEPRKGIGIVDWLFRSRLECIRDAAYCLATLGPAATPAVPALIEGVRNGPNNYDTGDGVIYVRDAIVEALGRTADANALPVLIEALGKPKPLDVSYGAIPRDEPVGERAALTALGHMGPAAVIAVPKILPYLQHHDTRIVEVAAAALGDIGDTSAIPALIGALQRDEIAHRVAQALERFGASAAEALPSLVRLIEQSPDRDGGLLIRMAIASIGGRTIADALPKTYNMMLHEVWRVTRARLLHQRMRPRGVHMNGPKEEFTARLPAGNTLRITMQRAVWDTQRSAEGVVTLSRPGAEPVHAGYRGIDQLLEIVDRLVAPSSPR